MSNVDLVAVATARARRWRPRGRRRQAGVKKTLGTLRLSLLAAPREPGTPRLDMRGPDENLLPHCAAVVSIVRTGARRVRGRQGHLM